MRAASSATRFGVKRYNTPWAPGFITTAVLISALAATLLNPSDATAEPPLDLPGVVRGASTDLVWDDAASEYRLIDGGPFGRWAAVTVDPATAIVTWPDATTSDWSTEGGIFATSVTNGAWSWSPQRVCWLGWDASRWERVFAIGLFSGFLMDFTTALWGFGLGPLVAQIFRLSH
jgi:hypothetical protein